MLFFSYLRIMKPILLFNPEHDLALANGDRHFIAPRNIREMAHDLSDIMEMILPTSDSESSIISALPSAHPFPWGWDPTIVEHFKKMGIVIYIYVGADMLIKRLGDFSKRGIVLKEGQTIDDLFAERAPLLEKYADIKINCNGTAYPAYQSEAIRKIKEYM